MSPPLVLVRHVSGAPRERTRHRLLVLRRGPGNIEEMSKHDYQQRGGWLPEQDDLESWLQRLQDRDREQGADTPLHSVVERLRQLVESDPSLRMYMIRMIEKCRWPNRTATGTCTASTNCFG